MWEWLNTNAGAVQAVAAGVSAFVAWKLVALTRRYVDLTGILAESAKQQVEIAKLQAQTAKDIHEATRRQQKLVEDAKAQAERQLSSMAAKYLAALAGLSSQTIAPSALQTLPRISTQDLDTFSQAAIQANVKPDDADAAASGLSWLAGLQERVAVSQNSQQFSQAETTMYSKTVRNVRESLRKLTNFRPASEEY